MRRRTIKAVSLFLLAAFASALGAIKGAAAIEQEKREVDELIRRADSTELRKLSPRILRLAEDLRVAKGDAEARPYFEKGLEGNAWALDGQLALAEILARSGQPEEARKAAEITLVLGEDDRLLRFASKILGRPVKWIEDRGENLTAAPQAREEDMEIAVAVKDDGTILGLEVSLVMDQGSYYLRMFLPALMAGGIRTDQR